MIPMTDDEMIQMDLAMDRFIADAGGLIFFGPEADKEYEAFRAGMIHMKQFVDRLVAIRTKVHTEGQFDD